MNPMRCVVPLLALLTACGSRPERGVRADAAAVAPDSTRGWRPAAFQGLTVGRDPEARARVRFGRPESITRVEWSDSVVVRSYEYKRGGAFPGRLVVDADSARGVIVSVTSLPDRLTVAEAIAHFGPGWRRTRYATDECLADAESAPLYERRDGPVEYLEYRGRGIAIPLDAGDTVREIYYRDGTPLGAVAPTRCARPPAL